MLFVDYYFSSLYILDINPLSDVQLARILPHSLRFLFTQLLLCRSFRKVLLVNCGLSFRANGILAVSPSPHLCPSGQIHVLSQTYVLQGAIHVLPHTYVLHNASIFSVSGLMLMPLIHLELVFVQSARYGSNFILLAMLSLLQCMFLGIFVTC